MSCPRHNEINKSIATVVMGSLMFLMSQSVSRCAEFVFEASFGRTDTVLKHVTYVCVVATLVLGATAVLSEAIDPEL